MSAHIIKFPKAQKSNPPPTYYQMAGPFFDLPPEEATKHCPELSAIYAISKECILEHYDKEVCSETLLKIRMLAILYYACGESIELHRFRRLIFKIPLTLVKK